MYLLIYHVGLTFFIINFSKAAEELPVLIRFKIEDQFKRDYTENSWDKDLLVFITGDRKGSQYFNAWGAALKTYFTESNYSDQYQQISIASLPGVPRLVRALIRGMFPDDEELWILMDWNNAFHENYQLVDDATNILFFDKERRLIFKQDVKEFTDESFKEISKQLEQLL